MKIKSIRLTIDLPFILHLPAGEYACQLGGDPFVVIIEQILQSSQDSSFALSVTMVPATGHVEELPRTRVSVQFRLQILGSSDEETDPDVKERARRFLNAYIDSYRYIFNDTIPYALSPGEFYAVRFGLAPRYQTETRDESGHGKRTLGVTFGDQPLTISAVSRSDDEMKQFNSFLQQNAQPPLESILILNAKGCLSRGDFRLAVIEAASALDISIEDLGRHLLIHGGMEIVAAQQKVDRMSTKTIVEQIIQPKVKMDVLENEAWRAYDLEHRPLRNSVVHDAKDPSKQEAGGFLGVIEDLIQQLRDACVPS